MFQTYYGVSAEIVGFDPDKNDIKTEITIDAEYLQHSDYINYTQKEVCSKLNIEVLDNNFTAIRATVYTKDSKFGTSKQIVNSGWSS